jgi:hypothetical protein
MRVTWNRNVTVACCLSLGVLLYGAKAAALFDFGGNALLADLLANATKQLAVTTQSLAELRRSYAEVKKVTEYADDAADAARTFQGTINRRFGDRFQSQLDAAYPDLDRYRREALAASGMGGSSWATGTSAGVLRGIEGSRMLSALQATFGRDGATQARAVDAEVAATLRGDAAQGRVAELQKARLRELLRLCNRTSTFGESREAKRFAEECGLAAQQAQLLHLEEGQETNVKLSEIARLQALAIEQKNAELRRELAEQEARRAALTSGLEGLSRQRVTIRAGEEQ